MKWDVAEGIARRFIHGQVKAAHVRKLKASRPSRYRPYRITRVAKILTNDAAQWGRVLDLAEGKFHERLQISGAAF